MDGKYKFGYMENRIDNNRQITSVDESLNESVLDITFFKQLSRATIVSIKKNYILLMRFSSTSQYNFIRMYQSVLCLSLFLMSLSNVHAAIIPNNTSSATMSNTSSVTISHITPSGANRLMMVGISAQQRAASVTSVTYNGVALTKLGNLSHSSQTRIEVWYLKNPSIGTFNVVVSNSQSDNAVVGVKTYSGVDLTTPFGTLSSAFGTSTTASVSVSSAVNELVFGVVGFNNGSTNITPGAGQTEYYDKTINSSIAGSASEKAGAASVTMTWTSTSVSWTIGTVSIKPAPSIFPGGVSGAAMWLKADLGVTTGATLTWADQSGFNRNGVQSTATNQAVFNSNVFNFNPALTFDGTNDYLTVQNLFGLPTGAAQVQEFAIANHLNTASNWAHIFSYGTATTNQMFGLGKHNATANATNMLYSFDAISASNEFTGGKVALLDAKYTGTQGIISSYGVQRATVTSTTSRTSSFGYVGVDPIIASSTFWNGNIPEIILFPTNLTTLQTNQVNSYLALKYGVTLDQTAAQNYTASDGTTIYWNGTTNSAYKNNIAGLVRDDLSAQSQKQSKSANAGLQVIIGNGNTIAATNIANASTFSADKSALVWGDNAGSVAAWSTTGAPTSRQITGRIWRAQETGTVGSVKIQIADNSGTNGLPQEVNTVYLLVDADGNFTAGATEIAMTLNGTNWEANVDLTNGQYFTFATQVQKGPGGVLTNSTLWLKADANVFSNAGTVAATNGGSVQQWNTQVGTTHATQTTALDKPIYYDGSVSQSMNYNPVLSFVSNDEMRFASRLGITGTNPFTMIALTKQSAFGRIFGPLATSSGSYEMNVGTVNAVNAGVVNIAVNNTTVTDNIPHIQTTSRSANTFSAIVDAGTAITGSNTVSFTGTENYDLGSSYNNAPYFSGSFGEFILYSSALSATDYNRVNSYLAIKYGVTLNQATAQNYTASDGTTVFWNGTTNSGHKNNIAGIARDDNSELNQKQSKSTNAGLQVAIGSGNTVAVSNAANTNNFSADKSALIWGDNGGSVSAWATTGSPSSLRQIVSRTWKVQKTAAVASVKVLIADDSGVNGLPAEVNTVYLLLDADGNFASGATEIVMTLTGNNWEANVDFTNGQFFTFATNLQLAPGGVVTNNTLWLKADAGTSSTSEGAAVDNWTNSASGAQLVSAVVGFRPIYRVSSSNFNYNPVLYFGGVDDYFTSTSNFGVTGTSLFTAFAVSRRATHNTSDMFFGGNASANNNFGFSIHSSDQSNIEANNFGTKTGSNATSISNVGIIKGVRRTASNTWQLYHNGGTDGSAGTISGGASGNFAGTLATSNLNFGAGRGTQDYFDGDISEIIIHSGALTDAEILNIESYLALKYGITLDQTIAHNYVASDGTTIYWNGTTNSIFKNNISGIVRDDASALLQKQSKSVNTGLQIVIGNGNSITANNIANTSSISVDRSAMVWGDDNGSVTSWVSAGAPANYQILTREWRIQETGTIGSVKIQIADNSGTNGLPTEVIKVFLLTDTDGDFTSGATPVVMTLNGTNWEANVDFTNGQYFTFATLLLSTSMTNVACFNGATGAINLNVAGSGYTFNWSNASTSQNLTGLAAGGYVVTITDISGVTATASATVTQPGTGLSLSNTVTNVSTTGATNGSIVISVAGGSPAYAYLWSNAATTQNISSLAAGNFTVTVSDANSCSVVSSMTVGTNSNSTIVQKQLYLSDNLSLDRENPAAAPFDNTTALTSTLSNASPGITIGNITSSSTTTLSTINLSHTIAAGENRLLMVGISLRSNTVLNVTYAGTAMTLEGTLTNGSNAIIYVYRLINPPVGTANISATLNGIPSNGAVIGGINYYGVNPITPFGGFASAKAKSAAPTVNVPSDAGDLIFNVVSVKNTSALTPGAGQTERWDIASGQIRGGVSTKVGTVGTTSISWTSGSGNWAIGAIALKPATFISSVTFTQNPVMCSALTVKANNNITFNAYVQVVSGTMPASPNITAVVRNGATNIITLINPSYNSSTGLLTWTGTRGTDITIAAGQAISIDISTAQAGVTFGIRHDSQTYPSKITFPVSTFINVNSIQIYNAAYPSGSLLASVSDNSTTYLRVSVSDPFGVSDISNVNLTLTKPNSSTISAILEDGNIVSSSGCTNIYQYLWSNPGNIGTWNIQAVANEGTEGVTHSSSVSVSVTAPPPAVGQTKFLYLSDPTQALDRIDPVSTGDGTTSQTVTLSSTGTTTATFAQSPALCGNLTLPAGGNVAVKAYTTVVVGTPITIAHASTSSGSAASVANGGTLTFSHTPGAGSNRLLLVAVSVGNTGVSDEAAPGTVTSVTFGGTAMTLVNTSYSGIAVRTYIYRLVNPGSAAANVVITIGTKTSGVIASATTFTGVNQTTPLGTGVGFGHTGTTNLSGSVTSAVGELVYSSVAIDEYVNVQQSVTTTSGQTQLWNNSGFDWVSGASSIKDGASSVTVGYTFLDIEDCAMSAVSIKPATSTSIPNNPNITAVLKYGTTTFATLTNASYNSSTNLLTWTGSLASAVNVPAGQAISLVITTAEPAVTFKIDFDSQTRPSKIELPVVSTLEISSLAVYSAAFPGGSVITSGQKGATLYVRATVTSPFGTSDITSLNIFNAPLGINNLATSVATSGCTRTYQYVWNTPNAAGDYIMTATAKEGYENTYTDVKAVNFSLCPITLSPTVASSPTCNAPAAGNISLNVSEGSGPYSWNWSRVSPAATNTGTGSNISGLTHGTYNITVTSAGGCIGTASVTLNQPFGPTLSAKVNNTGALCYDGIIEITATGGSGSYSYFWADGSSAKNRSNLTPGTYSVTVTDIENGCTASSTSQILLGSPILVNAFSLNPECSSGASGLINITPSGGAGSYTYLWSGGVTTKDRTSLPAGTYQVTVSDLGNCTAVFQYILSNPSQMVVTKSKTDVTCTSGGSITINVNGGIQPYQFNWADILGNNDPKDRSGLLPGTYIVTITDASLCSNMVSTTLNAPECNTNARVSCISENADKFKVDPNPDVTSYQWRVSPGAIITSGQGTSNITVNWTGASQGNGEVCVYTTNNCGESGEICTSLYLKSINATAAVEPICNGADINLLGSGGVSYQWSGPNSFISSLQNPIVPNATLAKTGIYTVTVTNENGCTGTANINVTLNGNPVLSTSSVPNSSCTAHNGSINLNISQGTSPYNYQWSNGNFTEDPINLAAGIYNVTVTDANGCTAHTSTVVTNTEGFNVSLAKSDVKCYNGDDGFINMTVNSGGGSYSFQWSNGATTQNVSNIKAGLFQVTVTDDEEECFVVSSVTILQPSWINHDIQVSSVNAFGSSSGSINLMVSGGTSPYGYNWADIPGNNYNETKDRVALSAGVFAVSISDINNCIAERTVEVTQPLGPLTPIIIIGNVSCFGSTNGFIDLSVSGGRPPYTYLWSGGQTTEDIKNLAPGFYTVTITDIKTISVVSVIEVGEPELLTLVYDKIDLACNNDMSGQIDVSASGGTFPYSYLWSTGSENEDLNQLSAGTYTVTVVDDNLCSAVTSIMLNEAMPLLVNVEVNVAGCFGANTGSINLTVTGGTGTYSYAWSNSAVTQDINNLAFGNYTVTITDAALCSKSMLISVEQNQPLQISAGITHLACNSEDNGKISLTVAGGQQPYTYAWYDGPDTKDRSDLAAGVYMLTITDANLCTSEHTFTINQPDAISVNAAADYPNCYGNNQAAINVTHIGGYAPFQYAWSTGDITQNISGLSDGIYFVTVTDANGCSGSSVALITQPSKLVLTGVGVPNCPGQANGSLMLYYTGGVEPYHFTWSDGGPNDFARMGLSTGIYTATVTDNNGCTSKADFTLQPVGIQFFNVLPACAIDKVSGNLYVKENGEVYAKVSGGIPPYTYNWSTGSTNSFISNLALGIYSVTVESNGCVISDQSYLTGNACIPPVAADDFYMTEMNIPVSGNCAINDYDPNTEYPLTFLPLGYVDQDKGVISWDSTYNGAFKFTPTTGYFGSFTVPYQVCDTLNLCAQGNLTIRVEKPIIGAAKEISNGPINNGDGSFDVDYSVLVENSCLYTLSNIQLTENLDQTFAEAISFTVKNISSSTFTINPSFNGASNKNLLSGSNSLFPQSSGVIIVTVTLWPGQNRGPYYNQILVSAVSPANNTYTDLSQNGPDPDPDNDGDPTNNNVPTPLLFCPAASISGSAVICVGGSTQMSPSSGGVWSSLNPTIATISNSGLVTAIAAGTARFIYAQDGCSSEPSAPVTVIGHSGYVTGSTSICLGNTTTLSPSTGGVWSSSNPSVATVNNAGIVTGVNFGSATFIFTELATGCVTLPTEAVIVSDKPVVNITGPTAVCIGNTTIMSPSSGGSWVSNNPAVAAINNGGVVTGISQGIATFTFTLSTGCVSNPSAPVTVNGNPSAILSGDPEICLGTTTSFLPSTGGTWTSNHPEVATITNSGLVAGISTGNTSFTFRETSSGCYSLPTQDILVKSNPVVSLAGASAICAGQSTTLSPSSGGIWTSSNSAIATVTNAGVVFGLTPGQTTFRFRSNASQCISNPTLPVTINERPVINYTGTTNICVGSNTTLTASTSGYWTSSNPAIAQINASGIVTAIAPGSVTFTFTSTNTGCISNVSSPLTVLSRPSANVTGPTSVCVGNTTTLSPGSGGVWTSSNTSVATINNSGIATAVSAGSVTFYFTETSTGCISNSTISVLVNTPPVVSFTGPTVICVGAISTLSPTTGGSWISSNPTVATVTSNGIVTGVSNGLATFIFTAINGCPSTTPLQINVSGAPAITLNGPASICFGTTTSFLPSSGGVWVSSNASVATILNSGLVTGVSVGFATFTYTESASGCVSSATIPVTVNGKPTVSIIGPVTICEGSTTIVSPTVNGSWLSTHPQIASVNNSGLVTGISAGTSGFIFTQSSTGCASNPTAAITVNARPVISLTGNNPICIGSITTLSPSTGGTWTSTNPLVASVNNAGLVTGNLVGSARFIFISSVNGCISSQSTQLIVQAKPVVSITGSTILCAGTTTTLSPTSGGVWSTSNPSVATVNNNGLVTAVSPGTATFTFTDAGTACSSNATQPISVIIAPTLSITGPEQICVGFSTNLSPSEGGIWTSNHPNIAIINASGQVTGISAGFATFNFMDASGQCSNTIISDTVYVRDCFEPDFNITTVNVSVNGNVKTNDMVPLGTVYGTVPLLINKPVGSSASITMSSSGSYTFIANLLGEYTYHVPVCASYLYQNCPFSTLKILVLDVESLERTPIANMDHGYTYTNVNPALSGNPIILKTLTNDYCIYASGCNLDPLTVTIVTAAQHGITTISANGNITYIPNPGFSGKETYIYKVCIENEPLNCDTALQIVQVMDVSFKMGNFTLAEDDYFTTYQETSISGNVKLNDLDPEGDVQIITSNGSALTPVNIPGGKYYIDNSGDFTFIPNKGFSGPTSFIYTTCDDNESPVCAQATVHIFVLKDLSIAIRVYLEGSIINNNNAKSPDNRHLMRDNLRMSPFTGQSFIPVLDPYSYATEFINIASKFTKVGAGTLSKFHAIEDPTSVLGVTGQNAIVDWVFVELRSKNDNTQIVASRSGLLQRDGDVVDTDGFSPLAFPRVAPDSFYVVIRHRNHLGAMSMVISSKNLIDFTMLQTPIYSLGFVQTSGLNYSGYSMKENQLLGYRALWAGNFDADNKLKFVNPNDDQNILFFDVLVYPNNSNSSSNYNFGIGYLQGDFDMNSKAKYDNPNDDKNLLFSQLLLFPLNTSILSNYNYFIQQVPESR